MKKKISKKEKMRRLTQSQKTWEANNPVLAHRLQNMRTEPIFERQKISYCG